LLLFIKKTSFTQKLFPLAKRNKNGTYSPRAPHGARKVSNLTLAWGNTVVKPAGAKPLFSILAIRTKTECM